VAHVTVAYELIPAEPRAEETKPKLSQAAPKELAPLKQSKLEKEVKTLHEKALTAPLKSGKLES
jgi:hypothetical protein